MATLEKLREEIADIVNRPNAVRFEEIERVIGQLKTLGWSVDSRQAGDHQVLFRVVDVKFGVCYHNKGSSQIKAKYVRDFKKAMTAVGLYEEHGS